MKKFTKRIENFTCEHCGHQVSGNGYTNHCPNCLVSKHVDINPGDRCHTCHGLMMPVRLERANGKDYIVHHCEKCGFERRNKISPNDNRDALIAVASGTTEEFYKRLLFQKIKNHD